MTPDELSAFVAKHVEEALAKRDAAKPSADGEAPLEHHRRVHDRGPIASALMAIAAATGQSCNWETGHTPFEAALRDIMQDGQTSLDI